MTHSRFYTRVVFSLLFVCFGLFADTNSAAPQKSAMSKEQKDIFSAYKKEQFFSNLLLSAAMQEPSQVLDFLSDVFSTMLVRKAILRYTSVKKISIPLLFTVIGGKAMLDWGISHGKKAPSFRDAYTKHFGTSSGWMWYYLRNKVVPGTIKRFAVGSALTGLAGLATHAGLKYPSWVTKYWWSMLLAMQMPVLAQETVSNVYDEAYAAIISAT